MVPAAPCTTSLVLQSHGEPMKLRKIELKTVTNDSPNVPVFSYREHIDASIRFGGQVGPDGRQLGISTDDVLRAVDVNAELKQSTDFLLLKQDDYAWLVNRVNSMRWVQATPQLADFIKDIRNAPEDEVTG